MKTNALSILAISAALVLLAACSPSADPEPAEQAAAPEPAPAAEPKAEAVAPKQEVFISKSTFGETADGEKYKDYINGSFMECDPDQVRKKQGLCTWENMAAAVEFFETELRSPQINALEVWGLRDNLQSMRAATTLALTHSNAYVLFADPNNLPTPDHLHDWYGFWDVDLGKPSSEKEQMKSGAFRRRFDNGVVVYNPEGNGAVKVNFKKDRIRASDGLQGRKFDLNEVDGDIFLFVD